MTLVEATKSGFRNYFRFSGRASRSEFWKFLVFVFIAAIAAVIVNSLLFGPEYIREIVTVTQADGTQSTQTTDTILYNGGWIGDLIGLACLLPTLAVGWRRLHDTGVSGWWLLAPMAILIVSVVIAIAATIGVSGAWAEIQRSGNVQVQLNASLGLIFLLLAVVPSILLLLRLCRRSDPGPNKYGPNPLEVTP